MGAPLSGVDAPKKERSASLKGGDAPEKLRACPKKVAPDSRAFSTCQVPFAKNRHSHAAKVAFSRPPLMRAAEAAPTTQWGVGVDAEAAFRKGKTDHGK
jgi:hypothetical protein